MQGKHSPTRGLDTSLGILRLADLKSELASSFPQVCKQTIQRLLQELQGHFPPSFENKLWTFCGLARHLNERLKGHTAKNGTRDILVQVAQLSQRDCAAGWVGFGQKWNTIFCRQYRSIFNHCDAIGLQSYQIR